MFISVRPSTYVVGSNVNLGSFGVTGVKSSFSLNMVQLVHVTQHDHKTHTCTSPWDLLPMLWGQMSIQGHLGSLGSKGHFHLKCYNSSMLHSMAIRLIQVDQLETFYICYGSNVNLGSFGVTGVKSLFSLNMLKLVHVKQHDHKTHTCSSAINLLPMLWGQMSIWGHLRSLGSKTVFTINTIIRSCYTAWS